MRSLTRWRAMRAVVVATLLVTPVVAAGPAHANPAGPPVTEPGWRLRWAPEADREGMAAFEHVEDDRAHSDPAGFPHIFVDGDAYHFTMNSVVRDTSTDRQRNEVRGLRTADGHTLTMLDGQTWRLTYSMFIPDTLKATTRFSHIMQLKAPGTGSNPIVTTSLRRYGTVPKMEVRMGDATTVVGAVDLTPLQNHWIDIDFQVHIGDAPDGWIRWIVRDGATTVIDTTMTGLDTWLFDRVRPKWGIYRSLGDTSGSLQDTYLLIRNLRAYQWSNNPVPARWARPEAEDATIAGCAVEATNGGYTGSGYADCQNQAGSSVEWTVPGDLFHRTATLNLWYANATPVDRPMDITLNGVLIAKGLDFGNTPAWTDWESRTLVVNLAPGPNVLRATATTDAGGPNLDSVEVEQPFSLPWQPAG
jgi:hypothetical protein